MDQYEDEPDEEAQVIEESRVEVFEEEKVYEIEDPNEQPEDFIVQQDGGETPDIDDDAKIEMLQRMQEEQEAISRRITRRKKSKKKKKARPATAKYVSGANRGVVSYSRPMTAKPKKKKKKTKKRNPEQVYLEQLRQQQMLQQLAEEQQQIAQQEDQQDQEIEDDQDGEIQITSEQAIMLFQQLAERQQNGEELSDEEMQQFQFLHNLIQSNIQQQEMEEQQQQVYNLQYKKTKNRKKSKPKKKQKKKVKKARQQYNPETLQMMMHNEQQMYQPNIGLPEGVDEIKEVDEEETPIREIRESDMQEDLKVQQYEDEGEQSEPGVHATDIPDQLNAQVPAHFRAQEEEEEEQESQQESEIDHQAAYPPYQLNPMRQENIQSLQGITPEQLYYLQEVNKNQMIASKLENYADMYNPLSQSVSTAKTKFKNMKNYDLDIFDKKLHEELICKRNGLKNFGVK